MRRFFCLALSVLAVCSLLSACTDDDPTAEPESPSSASIPKQGRKSPSNWALTVS